MTLIDGGSNESRSDRLRSRTYSVIYLLIPIIILLHIVSGHPWKASLLVGIVMMALAILFRPK